jgi:hypothetical protein
MVAAPLPPEELIARADLAIEARVMDVRFGVATLKVTRVLKRAKGRGRLAGVWPFRTCRVRVRAGSDRMALGDWSDERAYQPGRRLRAHLAWSDGEAVYRTLWWNAVSFL